MKAVIKATLTTLVLFHTLANAKSFHIEIPTDQQAKLKLEHMLRIKHTEYRAPGYSIYISPDGSVIRAGLTAYFVEDQRAMSTGVGGVKEKTSDNGRLTLESREDTFALLMLDDVISNPNSRPGELWQSPSRPWPQDVSRPLGHGISSDGSFVIGELVYSYNRTALIKKLESVEKAPGKTPIVIRSNTTSDAMWWTKASGFHFLARPKGWRPDGVYRAIFASTDGKTLLGEIENNQEPWFSVQPVLINRINNSARALGQPFEHPTTKTQPLFLSGDGKVAIVKASVRDRPTAHIEYFTWQEKEGYQTVKTTPETVGSESQYEILDINYDASIMVGVAGPWGSHREQLTGTGLVWVNGEPQKAEDFLISQGVDLHGWKVTRVTSISNDGKIIAGNADGAFLKGVAWFANLGDKSWSFPVHESSMTIAQALKYESGLRQSNQPTTITSINSTAPQQTTNAPIATASTRQSSPKSDNVTISTLSKPFVLPDYGHLRVVPKDPNAAIAPEIKAMWAKGFYIHMKEGGNFGFNTDEPGPYLYLPVNRWENKNGVFTLTLDTVVYAFTLPTKKSTGETTLKTVDSTLNAFEMTYVTKEKGVR